MISLFDSPSYLFLIGLGLPALVFVLILLNHFYNTCLPFLEHSSLFPFFSIKTSVVLRSLCFLLSWFFLIAALASPRWGTKLIPQREEGLAVVFVMDVSRSMTVSDLSPDRLTFSKEYASLLLNRLENSKVGVVLVKGKGHLAIPLTSDYRSVLALFENLSPLLVSSPGSALASGLYTAIEAFPKEGADSKIIILFTDGDETSGALLEAAQEINKAGIQLLVVGIGSEEGASISIIPNSKEGGYHTTKLNTALLQKLASISGNSSVYVTGTEPGSALELIRILQETGTGNRFVYSPAKTYRYSEFLSLAFIFFGFGLFVGGRSWTNKKK